MENRKNNDSYKRSAVKLTLSNFNACRTVNRSSPAGIQRRNSVPKRKKPYSISSQDRARGFFRGDVSHEKRAPSSHTEQASNRLIVKQKIPGCEGEIVDGAVTAIR